MKDPRKLGQSEVSEQGSLGVVEGREGKIKEKCKYLKKEETVGTMLSNTFVHLSTAKEVSQPWWSGIEMKAKLVSKAQTTS